MSAVSILGTGFAALTAVRKLRTADSKLEITVIAPQPNLVYLPSLIWLPSDQRKPEDIVIPLDNFFKRNNVKYVQGAAEGLEDGGRTVKTTNGDVENDGLIIGTGGRFLKKLPGIENAITPCEGVDPVMKFKEKLEGLEGGTLAFGFAGNPKEKSAVRGGPMFEFLFGTDELLRRQGRRDKFKIAFFCPAPKPGDRLGPKAQAKLMDRMRELGIDIYIGHKLVRFEADKVVTEGTEFAADLILFMPGMTGNKWFDNTDLPRSAGGLIKADAHCKVEGFERTYVAGDSGSFPGPDWQPKQAHMADLQSAAAAANLVDELNGKAASHTFRVELLCVIDDNKTGVFVARTPKIQLAMPRMRLAHRTKEIFERKYIKLYR